MKKPYCGTPLRVFNLPIAIKWEKFVPGSSFFIPCINRGKVERDVIKEANRLQINVLCKHVIERGRYGLRVWRVEHTIPPHSTSPNREA